MADLNVMYSSKTDDWSTPIEFFQMLDREFQFNLDPCASDDNHKCETYFTKEQDGLLKNWGGTECFATHHMARRLGNGCGRHTKKDTRIKHW